MQSNIELEEMPISEKEYINLLQRTQADFINYKHRVEQERGEQIKLAGVELIIKLLPVLDDFRRAEKVMPIEITGTDWAKGIELIKRNLMAVLEEEGLIKIGAEGKNIDPKEHEALFYEESDKYLEGKVKTIFRDGYRLNGRVIRPARVSVSSGKNKKRPNIAIKRNQERRKQLWEK